MDAVTEPAPREGDSWKTLAAGLAVVVIVLAGGWYFLIRDSGPRDHSAAIASRIGSSSCTASGYLITNKLSGSKQIIYDCLINDRYRCVTEDGGIASDSTTEVKLLFQNTLGAGGPACIS